MKWPIAGLALLALGSLAFAKDKSDSYQMGTYVSAVPAGDGTITDNFDCGTEILGSTVCSGGIHENGVTLYTIQVATGIWEMETYRQASDSAMRRDIGQEPSHFKAEKPNPLDSLKSGDRVLFRVEKHKKLLRTEIDIYIPFASDPNKEAKFIGTFHPSQIAAQPQMPSDNVRAMCDAHKLSADLEKQYCAQENP